ncbi:MAG: hypothetical protein AAB354_11335, partial [candidate division KSB1 bacterium]
MQINGEVVHAIRNGSIAFAQRLLPDIQSFVFKPFSSGIITEREPQIANIAQSIGDLGMTRTQCFAADLERFGQHGLGS